MKRLPISIFDCMNAKWPQDNEYIYCSKGRKLGSGKIHTRQVDRGDKLLCRICQICSDWNPFDIPYEKD